MELLFVLATLILISALSPFFGVDTRRTELLKRR